MRRFRGGGRLHSKQTSSSNSSQPDSSRRGEGEPSADDPPRKGPGANRALFSFVAGLQALLPGLRSARIGRLRRPGWALAPDRDLPMTSAEPLLGVGMNRIGSTLVAFVSVAIAPSIFAQNTSVIPPVVGGNASVRLTGAPPPLGGTQFVFTWFGLDPIPRAPDPGYLASKFCSFSSHYCI